MSRTLDLQRQMEENNLPYDPPHNVERERAEDILRDLGIQISDHPTDCRLQSATIRIDYSHGYMEAVARIVTRKRVRI